MVNEEGFNYITVESDRKPMRVTVWMSETQVRNKRDFRLMKYGDNGVVPQNCQYRIVFK